jgi:hypothetical protein
MTRQNTPRRAIRFSRPLRRRPRQLVKVPFTAGLALTGCRNGEAQGTPGRAKRGRERGEVFLCSFCRCCANVAAFLSATKRRRATGNARTSKFLIFYSVGRFGFGEGGVPFTDKTRKRLSDVMKARMALKRGETLGDSDIDWSVALDEIDFSLEDFNLEFAELDWSLEIEGL